MDDLLHFMSILLQLVLGPGIAEGHRQLIHSLVRKREHVVGVVLEVALVVESVARMKILIVTWIRRLESPGGKDGLMFLLHLLLVDHGMVKSIENELESRLESLLLEYTHHLGPDGNVGESQSHFQTLPVFLHQNAVFILLDVTGLREVLASLADGKRAGHDLGVVETSVTLGPTGQAGGVPRKITSITFCQLVA